MRKHLERPPEPQVFRPGSRQYIVIRYSVVDSIAAYHHVKSSEATYPQFMFMICKIVLCIAILIGPIFTGIFLALICDEYLKKKFYWYI
jgi:hypothetical protein